MKVRSQSCRVYYWYAFVVGTCFEFDSVFLFFFFFPWVSVLSRSAHTVDCIDDNGRREGTMSDPFSKTTGSAHLSLTMAAIVGAGSFSHTCIRHITFWNVHPFCCPTVALKRVSDMFALRHD